jgi:mono/diheme cytochrome c family protein
MLRATLIVCAVAAAAVPAAWAQDATPGDAARGQHLFMTVGCSQCHGTVAQGGVGPRLAPDPIPADAIAQYIRNPANVMPPYVQSVLGDAQVNDIHAYLASIKPPPKLQDIPLLVSAPSSGGNG